MVIRKVSAVLAVVGCVWMIWGFFSAPNLNYGVPPGSEFSITCFALGGSSMDYGDQERDISRYVAHSYEDADVDRATLLGKEQALADRCAQVRLNRLAQLGMVGFVSGIFLLHALLGRGPWSAAEAASSDQAPATERTTEAGTPPDGAAATD